MQYKIKEIRKKKRISQSELAELAGVSKGIIVRLEGDEEHDTQVSTLTKIAKALGVSVRSLFIP